MTPIDLRINPLVSCIMVTRDRRHFVPKAIACFLAQDYRWREMVIVNDGEDIADLIPRDPMFRYFVNRRQRGQATIGRLRNMACDLAKGELIAHWDDDDWSGPDRLSHQVGFMTNDAGDLIADIGGYRDMLFFDIKKRLLRKYDAGPGHYAVGTSLIYQRRFWRNVRQFPQELDPISGMVGEDNRFIEGQPVVTASSIEPKVRMVAGVHAASVSYQNSPARLNGMRPVTCPDLIHYVEELFK